MEKEVLRLFKGFLGEKSNVVNEKGLKYGLLIFRTMVAILHLLRRSLYHYLNNKSRFSQ